MLKILLCFGVAVKFNVVLFRDVKVIKALRGGGVGGLALRLQPACCKHPVMDAADQQGALKRSPNTLYGPRAPPPPPPFLHHLFIFHFSV